MDNMEYIKNNLREIIDTKSNSTSDRLRALDMLINLEKFNTPRSVDPFRNPYNQVIY